MHRELIRVLLQIPKEWADDKMWIVSAAIAFYLLFALAPVSIIALFFIDIFIGTGVYEEFARQLSEQFSPDFAFQVLRLIDSARENLFVGGGFSQIVTMGGFFFALYGLVANLHTSLNSIWKIDINVKSFIEFIYDQLRILSLVLILGALGILGVLVGNLINYINDFIGIGIQVVILDQVSLFFFTCLFIIILLQLFVEKFIPWKPLIEGSIISSFLILLGQRLLALYFSEFSLADTYGASASVVLVLLWINYTILIFFLGVEITKLLCQKF